MLWIRRHVGAVGSTLNRAAGADGVAYARAAHLSLRTRCSAGAAVLGVRVKADALDPAQRRPGRAALDAIARGALLATVARGSTSAAIRRVGRDVDAVGSAQDKAGFAAIGSCAVRPAAAGAVAAREQEPDGEADRVNPATTNDRAHGHSSGSSRMQTGVSAITQHRLSPPQSQGHSLQGEGS